MGQNCRSTNGKEKHNWEGEALLRRRSNNRKEPAAEQGFGRHQVKQVSPAELHRLTVFGEFSMENEPVWSTALEIRRLEIKWRDKKQYSNLGSTNTTVANILKIGK